MSAEQTSPRPATAAAGLFDLSGRVALVTGGAQGIGLAIATALAQAGAAVVLADRDGAGAEAAAQTLVAAGHRALGLAADVTAAAEVEHMVRTVEWQLGGLHVLVNNAGTQVPGQPEELEEVGWQRVLETNLAAVWRCSRAAYPAFRRAGGGKVINIASVLAVTAVGRAVAYGASKGGAMQLTRALATAWGSEGIQVNAILPGWTETALTEPIREAALGWYGHVLERTPAGRWGRPEDMAGAAVFLAGPGSDFVTGAGIVVDGGYLALG